MHTCYMYTYCTYIVPEGGDLAVIVLISGLNSLSFPRECVGTLWKLSIMIGSTKGKENMILSW